MIKISNNNCYDNELYLINQDNIAYICVNHTNLSKYPKLIEHKLSISLVNGKCLGFETTDENEFNKWLELFEGKE
jgi:hypothetical protein